jgi:hypothetical protein
VALDRVIPVAAPDTQPDANRSGGAEATLTVCGEYSLVKSLVDHKLAFQLKCRSWKCPECNPKRKKRLIAQIIDGQPTLFLTLTVRAGWNGTPEEARQHLWWCWRVITKRLKRFHKLKSIPYCTITEATKRGEPHFHIFIRSHFLSVVKISEWMNELANSPNVLIRALDDMGRTGAYACKYGGKASQRFNRFKRYFMTQDYLLTWTKHEDDAGWRGASWEVVRLPLHELDANLRGLGWYFAAYVDDGFEFRRC